MVFLQYESKITTLEDNELAIEAWRVLAQSVSGLELRSVAQARQEQHASEMDPPVSQLAVLRFKATGSSVASYGQDKRIAVLFFREALTSAHPITCRHSTFRLYDVYIDVFADFAHLLNIK